MGCRPCGALEPAAGRLEKVLDIDCPACTGGGIYMDRGFSPLLRREILMELSRSLCPLAKGWLALLPRESVEASEDGRFHALQGHETRID